MNDKKVALVGEQIAASLGPVAMSINGPDRAEINDFKGQSQARRLPDGRIEIAVQGSPHRGKRNEAQVLKVLASALSLQRGTSVVVNPPTPEDDARGIDGTTVARDGAKLVVQIVSVPVDRKYAHGVAQGQHHVILTMNEAIGWVQESIRHKLISIAPADRRSMILALDLRHAGLLAAEDFVAAYRHQIRQADLGFAEIWLVANVPTHSARIA